MKIIRHLDPQDRITYSELQADGTALLLKGDLFKGFQSTGKKAEVKKLLAPLAPIQILAIGLNYRRHAEVELGTVLGAEWDDLVKQLL